MNSVNRDNNGYNITAGIASGIVGWECETYLQRGLKYPVRKYMNANFNSIQGGGFQPYITKALDQNNLTNSLNIWNLNESTADKIKHLLNINDTPPTKREKILRHIKRRGEGNLSAFKRTLNGQNAFFAPRGNVIVCNFDKFGAPAFHEIQHKLNHISNKPVMKLIRKIEYPFAAIGPLAVSAVTMFTSPKAPEEKKGINDKIKKHCGLLSALCFLPMAIEEGIANVGGIKLAKKAGVTGKLLKKVQKSSKISLISYSSLPIIAGLSIWTANKIKDIIYSSVTKEKNK